MKKLLSLLFLLCSVAAFAEEEVQDMPVGRGECLSPGIILVPFLLLGIFMFAAPSIYYFAKRRGKINRNNKLWWIIISTLAGIAISPVVLFLILLFWCFRFAVSEYRGCYGLRTGERSGKAETGGKRPHAHE